MSWANYSKNGYSTHSKVLKPFNLREFMKEVRSSDLLSQFSLFFMVSIFSLYEFADEMRHEGTLALNLEKFRQVGRSG